MVDKICNIFLMAINIYEQEGLWIIIINQIIIIVIHNFQVPVPP